MNRNDLEKRQHKCMNRFHDFFFYDLPCSPADNVLERIPRVIDLFVKE